ncbi:MAG: hypothetical protein WAZ27_01120 [Minisyncoccia bacterium]
MSDAFAAGTFCSQETGTVVVFGNGIMNTEQDAIDSRDRIENLLRTTLTSEEFNKLEFALAYNHSYGHFSDLYESLKQRVGTDNVVTSFWRWMGGLEVLPDEVQAEFLRTATRFDFSTMVGPEDFANHLALYRAKTLSGKKVLVVSHSQGNFFANAAYQTLYSGSEPLRSRSFGIVSVANPASFVGGNGPYTTLAEDGIIAAIRLTTPPGIQPPLPPNLTNILSGARTSDWKGHSFLDEYMTTGSRSVAKIMPDVIATMNGLQRPPQVVQDGIITATLTWGAQPDVDLHAFEPNGTHVYYANERGISGELDLDDVDGAGPEHYRVSCSKLEPGTYRIGVNYYSGAGPETAFVQIAAGTSVRSFTLPLAFAIGRAGNENPVHVADVTVTGNVTDGFVFNIAGGS